MRNLFGKSLFFLIDFIHQEFLFFRKAVKAAIFLLPLLGITHVFETFTSAGNSKNTFNNIDNCFFFLYR